MQEKTVTENINGKKFVLYLDEESLCVGPYDIDVLEHRFYNMTEKFALEDADQQSLVYAMVYWKVTHRRETEKVEIHKED